MKTLAALFLLLAASAASGQTVKTLGYNTTNGEVIYSGTNALYFTNPALGFGKPPIFKVLTNDLSITNQTNLVTVDGLTLPTEAGKHYVVKLLPMMSLSTPGAVAHQIVASNATVTGNWQVSGTINFTTNRLTNALNITVAVDRRAPDQLFYVVGGTNSGSVSFRIANIDTNNSATVHAGSFMYAQEVDPQ
jgi:hypothetical protein